MSKIWDWAKDNSLAITTILQVIGFSLVMLQIEQATQRDIKTEKNIYHDHLRMVNEILLEEDNVRQAMKLTEYEVVGFLMLNDYQQMFEMRCDKLFKKDEHWIALQNLMYDYLRQGAPYHDFWNNVKRKYPSNFQDFVNNLIKSNRNPTPMKKYEFCQ